MQRTVEQLRAIRTFPALVEYLASELDWPFEDEDFEDLTFDYSPEELGLDLATAANIESIKQLRPLEGIQPWGIFFVEFEPKRLPVVALRRILGRLVVKKRASANSVERASWQPEDLLFISSFGEGDKRQISFAHFAEAAAKGKLPTLKVLGWDNLDTPLHLDAVAESLASNLTWPSDETSADAWREAWRAAFTVGHREVITTARDLSIRLAGLARAIRDRITTALSVETETGPLTKLMRAFQEALVHDLDGDSFADMYAQTIAYGLLSARIADPKRKTVGDLAGHMRTSPFLRELMEAFVDVGGRRGTGVGPDIDFDELGVSEVVELLDDANMEAVLRDFGDRNPQEDPVIHFYEHFLAAYDKNQKVQRGVFYTPRPVVSYIVRSLDELLRTKFGIVDGLADTITWGELAKRDTGLRIPIGVSPDQAFVQILDPATGTGTFLVEVIDLIHATMVAKWRSKGHDGPIIRDLWNEYVAEHLLPRLHGYELLMAPYAIAHLKIGLKLYETGYRFEVNERARVFLTNALEPASETQLTLDILPALANEADAVNHIKRTQRFTVVLGNPPYSKMSANLSERAVALVEPFRAVRGERIVEKGALALELNLQDDYVKFWGFLCSCIVAAGTGVAAYITNSRYLSSKTLRGLRAYIGDSFSSGFFLDLGGQVSERRALGVDDENVFDIEQGVAVGALVRSANSSSMNLVRHGRLAGSRQAKHAALEASVIQNVSETVPLRPPIFSFSRASDSADEEFESWFALNEMMPFNSGCIITSRDNLAIDFDRNVLLRKIERFAHSAKGDKSIEKEIGYSVKAKWDVERCKAEIRSIDDLSLHVQPILYRPFDSRYIFYLPSLLDTPSRPVSESVWGCTNVVLLTPGVKTSSDFNHALVSRQPAEKKACSHDRATQMFPLYAYAGDLSGEYLSNIRLRPGDGLDDSAALAYVYAILHSQGYRTRYGNALRDSYPRVPLAPTGGPTPDLCRLGHNLVDLHLLDSPDLERLAPFYSGQPHAEVGRVGWSENTVWLDAEKTSAREGHRAVKKGTIGFDGVPEAVWDFHIGGYQVCHKWLKDRKGRTLSGEDIGHYQKIVYAVSETIRLMGEIDEVIEEHGGWPAAFASEPRVTQGV